MHYKYNFAFYDLFHFYVLFYYYVISEALFQDLTEKEILQESWTAPSLSIQL